MVESPGTSAKVTPAQPAEESSKPKARRLSELAKDNATRPSSRDRKSHHARAGHRGQGAAGAAAGARAAAHGLMDLTANRRHVVVVLCSPR